MYKFTKNEEQTICNLYQNEKLSLREVADEFMCDVYVIRRILRKYNIKTRRRTWTPEEREEKERLINQLINTEEFKKLKTKRKKVLYLVEKVNISEWKGWQIVRRLT